MQHANEALRAPALLTSSGHLAAHCHGARVRAVVELVGYQERAGMAHVACNARGL